MLLLNPNVGWYARFKSYFRQKYPVQTKNIENFWNSQSGTADDNSLFDKIYSKDNLREALLKLSAMREVYLMKFELLWTPQTANEYLTEEELLIEYTDIMPL